MSDGQMEQGAVGPGPAEQATVGQTLRLARETRGETVGDVADALKLTYRQVEAMEAGHFDVLPGPAFVRGFVRNYARHLGLDPAVVLKQLERETAAPTIELAPVSNAEGTMPNGDKARPTHRPVAFIVVLLVLAVAAGWYFDWFKRPETATSIEVQPAPSVPADVAPPAPEPAGEGEGGVPAPGPASSLRMTPAALGWEMSPATVLGSASAPAAEVAPPAAADPVPSAQPAKDVVAAPGAPAEGDALVFRVEGESWLEVRDASGKAVLSGVVPPGSVRTVQGQPPFKLVVGNAPKVSLEYRGQPVDLSKHHRGSVARLTLQ